MTGIRAESRATDGATVARRATAYAVHLYTASGVAIAFWAVAEVASAAPDPRFVFILLAIAVIIDSTDGPLARRCNVKRWAPNIDGRTIDDIVDYLTFTFVPLLLVWRMDWLPEPAWLWIVAALIASLFGFANTGAKDETGGFFLGFPSYWNVVAFYLGIWYFMFGPWINAVSVLLLILLTVVPVGFIYPNLAPRPWRLVLTIGALVWLVVCLAMLAEYPHPPEWMMWVSLLYPALYVGVSIWLWRARTGSSVRSAPAQ
ncbi:phosphatidylcholine synthase [soil metagenome]